MIKGIKLMKQIRYIIGAFLLLAVSVSAQSKQCVDGKKTIKQWVKDDGTYSTQNLPKEVVNSKACLLKPMKGDILQSTDDIHSFISQQFTRDNKRKVSVNQLPTLLEKIGNKYDVYLISPCKITPTPSSECQSSKRVILGYVAESQIFFGTKVYAHIDLTQFIEY